MKDEIRLNKEQKLSVDHTDGPLMVIAGAGTGKTTVITHRISSLVERDLANTSEILALTFTEKASKEMEERVDVAMPYGYTQMWISTFHSFCDRVLRDEVVAIGMDPNYKLMTSAESIRFLQENLFEFDLKYFRPLGNPTKFIGGLLTHFSRLQDEDIAPGDYLKWASAKEKTIGKNSTDEDKLDAEKFIELANAYKKYSDLKLEKSKMDFGDLIFYALKLFRERPNVLKEYMDKFKYILVDEFQDTNIAQNELVKMLAGENGNITVVADDDQAIYKWRGASVSNTVQFKKSFPTAKIVTLTKNYRSKQEILDKAYDLIQFNNPNRLEIVENVDKKLVSKVDGKGEVEFIHAVNSDQEANSVAKKIAELVENEEYSFSDFAVFVRANNHSTPFIRAFERFGIPNQFLGPARLFQEEEILDLVSYLKVLYDYSDSTSFYRVLSMDIFDISQRDIIHIFNESKKTNTVLFDLCEEIDEQDVSGKTKKSIGKIVSIIKDHQKRIKSDSAGELLFSFVEEIDLLDMLVNPETENAERMAKNIAKLFEKIKSYENENEAADVFAVVDWIEMLSDLGESPLSAEVDLNANDSVNIMTIHGSKGLEFPVCFVVNLVNQRFPSTNRRDMIPIPESLVKEILPEGDHHEQEERRLFYVAATRAKEKLYLTAADFYGGGVRKKKISPFVHETLGEVTTEVLESDDSSKLEKKKTPPKAKTVSEKLSVDYLSYSQINAFETCPLHYKLRYIYKIPTEPTSALSFGTSMHNTLDAFFRSIKSGDKPSKKKLTNLLEANWQVRGYLNKKHEKEMFEKGVDYLSEYYKDEFDPNSLPIALEQPFSIALPLMEGERRLKIGGKIDRVDEIAGGGIEIIDYKTGENVPKQKDVDKDMQLTIYALAATSIADSPFKRDIKDIKLSLYYFKDQTKITTTRTQKQIDELVKRLCEVRREIEESDFKCSGNFFCNSCEFRAFCEKS